MVDLTSVELHMPAVRTGLAWAQSWTKGHILCKLGEGRMTFMVGDASGFLAVWSWSSPSIIQKQFFLIPPFVARTLSGRAAWEIDKLETMTNRNLVGAIIRSGDQDFRLQWKWRAAAFRPPRFFKMMGKLPDMMVRTPYVSLADQIHLAIANVISVPPEHDVSPYQSEGGILIDFMPGQINIDGESIRQQSHQTRYYFNPKMLMRGLEIVRESHLAFTIEEVQHDRNAVLFLACQREGWDIHCAVQSVGVNIVQTQSRRVRETRSPMEGGSWLMGQRPGEE